jgi:uncharacterized protein YndB with AHSA1/START domain
MTKEQRQRNIKLAEALESGEYEQGFGGLRNGDRYCCLGVATDIFIKETGLIEWEEAEGSDGFYSAEEKACIPPKKVVEYFGWDLDRCEPNILVKEVVLLASQHNDQGKATFKDIARGFRELASAQGKVVKNQKGENL